MNLISKLALGATLVFGVHTSVQAADLMSSVSVPETYDTAYDWSGFYAGVVGGVGILDASGPTDYYYGSYGYDTPPISVADWGGALGVTVGAQAQFGAGVVGVEADLSWASFLAEGSAYDDEYYLLSAKWNWFGTLRARAGLAVDNALIYATGGLAVVDRTYKTCSYTDCSGDDVIEYNGIDVGLAVGFGAEYALSDNMTLKGEYLYIGLPDFTGLTDGDYNAVYRSSAHQVRVGLNYKF